MSYDAHHVPTVKAFWNSDCFQRMLLGPFGSGKSSGCIQEIVRRAARQKPINGVRRTRWAIVRNSYPQLRDTTIRTVMDWYPREQFGKYSDQNHNFEMLWHNKAGEQIECEILFRALDRPDQISNLLSLELTGAWVNEAREIPVQIWQALQGRVGRFPSFREEGCTWYGVFGDSNPPDDDHWIYKLFEEKQPDNAAIFKQPGGRTEQAENVSNLPPEYYANLAAGKGDDFIRVYVDGEYGYVQEGKPVFPEFVDSVHCKEYETQGFPVYRGWDFGLSPACVFTQLLPNGQWRIFDEVIATRMGARAMGEQVIQHMNTNYPHLNIAGDYGDPAGKTPGEADEKTCFQILRAMDIYIEAGDQTLERRLDGVRSRLNKLIDGAPAFLVHPRCKVVRKALRGGYKFRRLQVSGERYTNKPEKDAFSHPMDALQYVATRLFQVADMDMPMPRVIKAA
nr:hypothetical protein [uncultured Gammaproteobacteria bacterium]